MVEDEDEEIEPVFQDLQIDDGLFTLKKYQRTKGSLKAGRSCGEDGIVPEVLKCVLIDDLVLHIPNKAFMDCELPRHLDNHQHHSN